MINKKEAVFALVNKFQGVIYSNYYATTGITKIKVIFNNENEEQEKYTVMSADEELSYSLMYDKISRFRSI
jgi:hypothetical protein